MVTIKEIINKNCNENTRLPLTQNTIRARTSQSSSKHEQRNTGTKEYFDFLTRTLISNLPVNI